MFVDETLSDVPEPAARDIYTCLTCAAGDAPKFLTIPAA